MRSSREEENEGVVVEVGGGGWLGISFPFFLPFSSMDTRPDGTLIEEIIELNEN